MGQRQQRNVSDRFTAIGEGETAILDTNGNDVTLATAISGDGGVEKTGSGTLTLTGTNTYTAGTTIDAGTLSFTEGALDNSDAITFDGGTLQWADGNSEDVSDRFAAIGDGQMAILDTNGNDVTLAAAISGDGGLEKQGDGTLILTGANTYVGDTTVVAGTLLTGDLELHLSYGHRRRLGG